MAHRMIGDASQDSAKVELRIEPVELRRAYEAVHGSGTISAAIGSDEQEVLSTKSDGS